MTEHQFRMLPEVGQDLVFEKWLATEYESSTEALKHLVHCRVCLECKHAITVKLYAFIKRNCDYAEILMEISGSDENLFVN